MPGDRVAFKFMPGDRVAYYVWDLGWIAQNPTKHRTPRTRASSRNICHLWQRKLAEWGSREGRSFSCFAFHCISTLVIGIQIYKHLRFINIQRKLCPLTKWEKDDSIHFLCGHHSNNRNNQDSDKQNNEHFHSSSFFHLPCCCYLFWRWRWCADAWGDLRGESGGEGAWATSLQCGWAFLACVTSDFQLDQMLCCNWYKSTSFLRWCIDVHNCVSSSLN